MWVDNNCFKIIPKNNSINNNYLYYLLKNNQHKINELKRGKALISININDLRNMKILIHSHEQQEQIVQYCVNSDLYIQELEKIVLEGKYKCFLLFIVQRTDVSFFQTSVIDPIYKEAVLKASNNGVKILVLQVDWNKEDGKAYFFSNNLPIIL